MNVTIESCQNGFIVFDHNTGKSYVSNKLSSYLTYDKNTVVEILQRLEDQSNEETNKE